MTPFYLPDWFQMQIIRYSEPVVAGFFKSLQNKDIEQAEQELLELKAINDQLREKNVEHDYRRDDHLLPLQDFSELLDAAKRSKDNKPDKDTLARCASNAKGKFELMGIENNGIPSQVRPGPSFASEKRISFVSS